MASRALLPPDVESALVRAVQVAQPYLVPQPAAGALAQVLYEEWYTANRAPKSLQLAPTCPPLVGMLRAAHAGTWRWEPGWRAERVSTAGRVQAVRGEERRLLGVSEYVSDDRAGLPPRPGAGIAVVSRRDSTELMPGFWFSPSAAWARSPGQRVRLYWNVTPAGAPGLVREITERLGDDLPYALKLPIAPSLYARSDAAVLYVNERAFETVRDAVGRVREAVARDLADDVPALTWRLAPGVGLAEDPGNARESFGTSRCRLVAEALVTAAARGHREPEDAVRSIVQRFSKAGVSAARPHLRDQGSREYALSL